MALGDLQQLTHAVEANWCAAWASLGAVRDELPSFVDDTPDFLRVFTPAVPDMLVNMVIRYRGPVPVAPGELERVVAPYHRNGLPFQWWTTMGDEPAGLREQLRALDMQSCGPVTCMALMPQGWTPPVSVGRALPYEEALRVATREQASAAYKIICDVFQVAPGPMARWTSDNAAFQLYLARFDGQPVAALATLRAEQTVGVYHVGTRPGYRRRGIAGRLLTLALEQARAQGARLATLTATPEARSLYESLGFHACGAIEQWVPGPDLMARLIYGGRGARARRGGW